MDQFIDKDEMENKFLQTTLNDPTSALILIQGHWGLHLSLWIVNLLTVPSRNILQCF